MPTAPYIFETSETRSGRGTVLAWAAVAALVLLVLWSVDWRFVWGLDFGALWPYRFAFLRAIGLTLLITGLAVIFGLVIGIALAIALQTPVPPLRWLVMAYVEIWRNTPLVVQLFWVHFALPVVTGVSTSAAVSGLIAMTLQASAYLTDITRAGIQGVPKGQREAAHALGLPTSTTWGSIVLPQALKIMIPPLANIAIGFFKTSAILSLLSVGELMSTANRISDATFRPIEALTVAAAIYFVFGYAFSQATYRLERLTGAG